MKFIEVEITGTTPLICNRYTDLAAAAATNGTRSTRNGDKGLPREQAEQKLYTDHDGTLVIPTSNILRCLIDAGKFFKDGKSKITTLKSSIIPAYVGIEGVCTPIISPGWEVDIRPVVIPATGGRILAYRPRFDAWQLQFVILLDDEGIKLNLLRDIVDAAGTRIGLGDFRPDRKGPYGRFVVTLWNTR